MKNWSKEMREEFHSISEDDDLSSKPVYADNNAGITSRALDIIADAQDLSSVISTLRAVNMDRLAATIASIQHRIIATAEPIPHIVRKELDESIAHGRHMLGGVMMLGMKLASEGKLTIATGLPEMKSAAQLAFDKGVQDAHDGKYINACQYLTPELQHEYKRGYDGSMD